MGLVVFLCLLLSVCLVSSVRPFVYSFVCLASLPDPFRLLGCALILGKPHLRRGGFEARWNGDPKNVENKS